MTVFANGVVVDGTGRAAFPGDVVVEGDTIADVVERGGGASRSQYPGADVIDAAGCIVSPGFIDCHSHSPSHFFGFDLTR